MITELQIQSFNLADCVYYYSGGEWCPAIFLMPDIYSPHWIWILTKDCSELSNSRHKEYFLETYCSLINTTQSNEKIIRLLWQQLNNFSFCLTNCHRLSPPPLDTKLKKW